LGELGKRGAAMRGREEIGRGNKSTRQSKEGFNVQGDPSAGTTWGIHGEDTDPLVRAGTPYSGGIFSLQAPYGGKRGKRERNLTVLESTFRSRRVTYS